MKRAMRDNHPQENDCNGEFHVAIKKQIITHEKIDYIRILHTGYRISSL
jgi:hypothetical protein